VRKLNIPVKEFLAYFEIFREEWLWDITLHGWVRAFRCFGGKYCLNILGLRGPRIV
jgi:hypothetical protein